MSLSHATNCDQALPTTLAVACLQFWRRAGVQLLRMTYSVPSVQSITNSNLLNIDIFCLLHIGHVYIFENSYCDLPKMIFLQAKYL